MSRPNAIVSAACARVLVNLLDGSKYCIFVDNPWDALITLKEFLKERKMDLKIPKYKKTK